MSAAVYSEENRAFNYAVLASIVLHALLLFGVSLRERAHRAEPQVPIVARLAELPAAAPAAAPPQAEPFKPRAEPVKPRPQPKPVARRPVAKEAPLTRSEPAPESAPEAAPTASPAREVAAPAQVEAPAAPPPLIAGVDQTPGQPAAASAAVPAEDPGSLERYLLELKAVAAKKYNHYPLVARRNDWKGVVDLRIVMAPGGRIASMKVTRTSGYDVLDRQAQEMFRSAAADVPIPPVLRGKQFDFELSADYHFTD